MTQKSLNDSFTIKSPKSNIEMAGFSGFNIHPQHRPTSPQFQYLQQEEKKCAEGLNFSYKYFKDMASNFK